MEKELIVATLIRRLNAVTGLDEADIAAIRALPIIVRPWRPGASDRFRRRPADGMLSGDRRICVRSKTIVNGQRQILSIDIPGDIPDLQSLYLHRMDHDLDQLGALQAWLYQSRCVAGHDARKSEHHRGALARRC